MFNVNGMNFNIVLRPFRRLQDILTCINLMNIFPNGMTNRENVIAEVLKRTTRKDIYTTEEVAITTENYMRFCQDMGPADEYF